MDITTEENLLPKAPTPPSPKKKEMWFKALATAALLLVVYGVYVFVSGIFVTRALARDAKRNMDIVQIQSALELYFNNHNAYPENLTELTKVVKNDYYLTTVPTAPKPADGQCSEEQNNYQYKKIGETTYEITYCLGQKSQSTSLSKDGKILEAGVQKITTQAKTKTADKTEPINQTPSTEFKFVSPKGGEKWAAGSIQTIAWTGGGKNYATALTFHYTMATDPYAGKTGEQYFTVKNQPGKNYDTFAFPIEPQAMKFWKGPYTFSACLVNELPGNAYTGCLNEEIISQPFEITPKTQTNSNSQESLTYTNNELKFQVTFTEAWSGYEIFTDNSTGLRVDIPKYQVKDPQSYGAVVSFYPLIITLLPKEEYDRYKANNDPALNNPSLHFLGEKNGKAFFYVDTATSIMDMDYYPKTSDGKPVDFEVSKVMKTFKFID